MTEAQEAAERIGVNMADIARITMPAESDFRSGKQLTPLRRAVLQALVQAGRPLGAYDLIARIEASTGRRLMPTSVYRILEFLLARGLAVRIESRNAYMAITQPTLARTDMYFICDHCGDAKAIENPTLERIIKRQATTLGFRVGRRIVEMQGICDRCQESRANHSEQFPKL